MGISSGNFFVSSQWLDVSGAGLVPGHTYSIIVTVVPQNALLTVESYPFSITYTLSRKRNLRDHKAKPSTMGAVYFATGEELA